MKLILSRKGVDSSAGGFASPIFPDGSMRSLPIPDPRSVQRYRDLRQRPATSVLVDHLSGGRLDGRSRAHIDPDLEATALLRGPQWRALFGQCGAAQQHLLGQGVDCGDLFLFFGWFREVERYKRRWRYVAGAPDIHQIFGWLLVGELVDLSSKHRNRAPGWSKYHPHYHGEFRGKNCLYVAADQAQTKHAANRIQLPDGCSAGVFSQYDPRRVLTAPGCSRSNWRLPGWIYPQSVERALSYHRNLDRWTRNGDQVLLKAANRGQEFVLDTDFYSQAKGWINYLLAE